MPEKLKVAYLLGAGSTHADIKLVNPSLSLLTIDVKQNILKKLEELSDPDFDQLRNELSGEDSDIEQLITLYDSNNTSKNIKIVRKLKEEFRHQVLGTIAKARDINKNYYPKLLTSLIDMHNIPDFNEELIGFLTINYDDFIEASATELGHTINYGFQIKNAHQSLSTEHTGSNILILKLHGSYNWEKSFITILKAEDKIAEIDDVLWIPPGIEKRNSNYPFNIIWGKARELLNCDVLRIIGCSLNRNDWMLLSLLYYAVNLNSDTKLNIELIDTTASAIKIKKDSSFLNPRLQSSIEIKEVREYFKQSYSADETNLDNAFEDLLKDHSKVNIFEYWLKAKANSITIKTETPKNIFNKFRLEI